MPIGSLLAKGIKELPDVMKAESVKPALLKKGVKQEELDYSEIDLPQSGKVTKDQMLQAEFERKDQFYTTELKGSNASYSSINLPGGKGNPTYREKVHQFRKKSEEEAKTGERWIDGSETSRYTSSHFPNEENYLMHTRIHDETMFGAPTRVLTEIQSDLHQAGRTQGYGDTGPDMTDLDQADLRDAMTEFTETSEAYRAASPDMPTEELDRLGENADFAAERLSTAVGDLDDDYYEADVHAWDAAESMLDGTWGFPASKAIPKSPYEKTWLRKGIERELSDAIDDNRSQLAIPISGAVQSLSRAPGVQKWYETQVVNTARKIAKKNGMDFQIKITSAPDESGNAMLSDESMVIVESFQEAMDTGQVPKALEDLKIAHPDIYEQVKNAGVPIQQKFALVDALAPKVEVAYAIIKSKTGRTEQAIAQSDIEEVLQVRDHLTQQNLYDLGLTRSEARGLLLGTKTPEEVANAEMLTFGMDKPNVSLYSSSAASGFLVYEATKAGMDAEQINAKLVEEGYAPEDIQEAYDNASMIEQGLAANMSMVDIKQRLEGEEIVVDNVSSEPAPRSKEHYGRMNKARRLNKKQSGKEQKFTSLTNPDSQLTAEELVTSLKVLHPTMVSDLLTTIPASYGSKEAAQRYTEVREASRLRIRTLAKELYNVDLIWKPKPIGSGMLPGGEENWFVQTPEGERPADPSFWAELKATSGEVALGTAGAIAGGKAAFTAAPPVLPLIGPLSKPVMGVLGAAIGGWAAATAGSNLDYLREAIELDQDMEAEAMAYRSLNVAEASGISEVLGYGVVKTLGVGWKAIVKAKNLVQTGRSQDAHTALKDATFLDDSQIEEIVELYEKQGPLAGDKYEKGIQAVALTQPKMQHTINAAQQLNPRAAAATANTVSKRAEDVLAQTARLTDDQAPLLFAGDLRGYVTDVKTQYAEVKARATQTPYGNDFEWDFEELAIQPVMEKLGSKITDPATKERFLLQMQRVNTMSENRSFGDLIELRQMANDFLYNKRVVKADDQDTLRQVINNIDDAIIEGADYVLENPKQWLDDWAGARKDYSQMKQVEKTAMYRAVFNKDGSMKSVQPETIVKAFGKYITALDGSFEQVMAKMPYEGRKLYEGAVVDHLAKKFTAGIEAGTKAIHFPMLADELKKITLTTPDARAAKKALIRLAEVFKNDVHLAQLSGTISMPKFMQGLSADLVVKAKFEAAAKMYSYIKGRIPSKGGRSVALLEHLAKLLEKPLDAKNFKALQEEVYGDANLSKQILELQQLAARDRNKEIVVGTPKVYISRGGKVVNQSSAYIPAHRILTLEQAKEIAEAEAMTLDSQGIDAVLKQYGYKAIQTGSDSVRILGDK